MRRALVIIILIFTIINISSFFLLKAQAPQYTVFTGAVHYSPDYLYYLSYIVQGRERWILGENLKSTDTRSPELVNWLYVMAGKAGYLTHIPPMYTYQLLVIASGIVYIIIAHRLLGIMLPNQPKTVFVALIIFLLSNAFPEITRINGAWDFGIYYPFNNIGHAFLRLSNVPHHTLIQASILAAFYYAAVWARHGQKKTIGILAALGFLLSSMQPLQWAMTTGVIGICSVWMAWNKYKQGNSQWYTPLFPAATMGIIGLPFALYIQHIYNTPLHTYMINWEKSQQIIIPFTHFITLQGPVVLLGMIAAVFFIRREDAETIPLYMYSILSILLFYSKVPTAIGLLNIRFLSVIHIFLASYICTLVLRNLAKRIAPKNQYAFLWLSAIVLLSGTIFVSFLQLVDRATAMKSDLNTYLPLGAFQIYEKASTIITPLENTLVTPLFSLSFPAFTGRHVFVADLFGTLQYDKKLKESNNFFSFVGTSQERSAWLRSNNIHYIFTYAWTPIPDLPNLVPVLQNDYAILYRVK